MIVLRAFGWKVSIGWFWIVLAVCFLPLLIGLSGAQCGCHSAAGPEQPPGNISGDRIVAQYIEADDGARAFVGWLDVERGERCDWRTAADGVTRCLPIEGLTVGPSGGGIAQVVFFADDACSRPLAVLWDDACANLHVAIEVDDSSCPVRAIVHSVEPEPHLGDMYGLQVGECVAMGPAAEWQYATIGEVPTSSFVGEAR